jgi:hypothetical protein
MLMCLCLYYIWMIYVFVINMNVVSSKGLNAFN